ncbi:MyD116-like domain protein [Chloriridovirus anopheles1]|uniref:Protein DP71L n=1 Tax=Chloriridovirus anopheles1 TaxID=1465751 RepID=W8QF34_9VIRU|nr:MyD116-like domain protein [Anopheles minimus iridovirus]AHL67574.1 MyD116-like domain protein [Anopheles minimus iridovirus]
MSTFYPPRQKIRFSQKIIIIFVDKEDRRGPWEMLARDRDRFHHRIQNINNEIGWIFSPTHRTKIVKRDNL